MKTHLAAITALLLCACPKPPPAGGPDSGPDDRDAGMQPMPDGGSGDAGAPIGHPVTYAFTPDPDPRTLMLPVGDAGELVLTPGAPVPVVYVQQPKGPVDGLIGCTRWISTCVSSTRALDDCALSVPTCQTAQPWSEAACCAQACYDRYAAARLGGMKDLDAFQAVYFDRLSNCMPGVSGALAAEPPLP